MILVSFKINGTGIGSLYFASDAVPVYGGTLGIVVRGTANAGLYPVDPQFLFRLGRNDVKMNHKTDLPMEE